MEGEGKDEMRRGVKKGGQEEREDGKLEKKEE